MKKSQQKKRNLRKPFIEHIHELRIRLFLWFIVFVVGSVIGFKIYDNLLLIIMKPLNKPLYYTSPLGGLNFVFQLAILFGFIVSLPMLIYQIIKFIEPLFSTHSKRLLAWLPFFSLLLAIVGICFAYLISLPATLGFFGAFGSNELRPLISTNEYFSFVTHYLLGIALLFQLPIILFVINLITPLDRKIFLKYQRHFIVLSFVIAAIFTLDPINQAIMAIPLILLYYAAVGIIIVINKRKKDMVLYN